MLSSTCFDKYISINFYFRLKVQIVQNSKHIYIKIKKEKCKQGHKQSIDLQRP